ncbi:MAG: nucleotidyltransferase domain-containing protein [candidate division KSB1 bacterium]|nr:nucleotidyltransferase domain-containing protein [candidate division KSB1 bacterium]
MKTIAPDKYLNKIVQALTKFDIKEIFLFGSVNSDKYNNESDIDLLVILDIDRIPENYEVKMNLRLELRKAIRDINRKVPIDLLVYTKKEFELKVKRKRFFSGYY